MTTRTNLSAAVLAATFLLASSAHAQKPGLPLKKSGPLIDKRSLAIPGKLPGIQRADPPKVIPPPEIGARRGSKVPPRKSGRKGKGKASKGFGDIKKTAGNKCRPLKSSDTVQFEFKGADIKDVVTAISKTMCKNFIITSKVRSQKFDIISPTPITVAEAWRAFLSALEANDFTLIQTGRYYKIIQSTDGTRSSVPIYNENQRPPKHDRMVTKIWRPKNAGDLNAVVNYLNIFKSGKGQIHPFHPTGVIIATDYGTAMNRLQRIFDEVDQPGAVEQVRVVPVEFAAASEIAEKLSQVFEPSGRGAGKGARKKTPKIGKSKKGKRSTTSAQGNVDGPASVSKIIADDRTNKLIIIASEAAFTQIMALKKQLDIPGESGDGLVHVLRLKHANAEELASTLGSLASGASTGRAKSTTRAGRKTSAKKTSGPKTAALFQGDVKVTADKPTNSLVITASKLDYESVKKVIGQLDVPRFQVFVEAVILEVSMKRDRSLGVSWHGGVPYEVDGKPTPILFGSTHSKLNALEFSTNPLSLVQLLGFAGAARGPPIPGTENLIPGGNGIPSVGVVLQALQSTNDINIVSTPHLLTMDNEEAEIQVSEKRPFPSGLSLGNSLGALGALAGQAGQSGQNFGNLGGLGLGSVAINREDVGLTLKLKPQINDQETVRLEIDQELSDVAGLDQVTQQTITSKRAAKTVVVVRDQDTVVIGGLVRDRESEDESKVPLLGDLPLLGWLFKRQQKISEKVNLLLILTPYIIRGPEDFRRIYKRKMAERREFVERFYGATPEYRASVDWTRKKGPLATFRQQYLSEMSKAENGGPGNEGELIIKADEQPPAEPVPGDDMDDEPDNPSATEPASGGTPDIPKD